MINIIIINIVYKVWISHIIGHSYLFLWTIKEIQCFFLKEGANSGLFLYLFLLCDILCEGNVSIQT